MMDVMKNKYHPIKTLCTFLHKVCFIILLTNTTYSQNYISYQKEINKCESFILERKYSDALNLYDCIFNSYNFCFAQDYFVALQVSCFINDTSRTIKYVKNCLRAGIKMNYISKDTITKKICTNKFIQNRINNIDSLIFEYYQSIDINYRGCLMELTSIDQYYRDKHQITHTSHPVRKLIWNIRWKKEVNDLVEERLIPKIIKTGYPGEKLIGLKESWMLNKYKTNDIGDATALLIFRHFYSFKNTDYSSLLIDELYKGNITSNHYAIIMDYIAKFGNTDNYYNQWHNDPDNSLENLSKINSKRIKIGLESLDEYKIKLNRAIKVNIGNKHLPLEYYFKLLVI
jgi:hypothetical protein